MITINKPKYNITVLTLEQLKCKVKEIEARHQMKYTKAVVRIAIEPDPEVVEFDGSYKEFTYKVSMKF